MAFLTLVLIYTAYAVNSFLSALLGAKLHCKSQSWAWPDCPLDPHLPWDHGGTQRSGLSSHMMSLLQAVYCDSGSLDRWSRWEKRNEVEVIQVTGTTVDIITYWSLNRIRRNTSDGCWSSAMAIEWNSCMGIGKVAPCGECRRASDDAHVLQQDL